MGATNFAALAPSAKTVWSRDVWKQARDMAFITKFMGTGPNNVIQRITELTKTERGEKCVMSLVADLQEDGQTGDNEREGNEEELVAYFQTIGIDLLTHGVKNKGKLADQKTVINFREHARDTLAYWLANRMDQLAFLTMSGVAYSYQNNGALRTNSNFPNLAFAADVTAPSTNRARRWDSTTNTLIAANTANVIAADVLTYKAITAMVAYAKEHYVKPLMAGGKEYYVCFLKPGSMATLKQDADYQRAVTTAYDRGKDNPWFTGGTVTVDGVVFHEHRLVYSTSGTATKWGAGNAINGTRTLLCGAQALGLADLGTPEWCEKEFDYNSKQGINIDKIFGLLKPKFHSNADNAVEDFGVVAVDHALPIY